MLTVATCFWKANSKTAPASVGYGPYWVNRLANGFRRNLTKPFRFVCFTDREYEFDGGIDKMRLRSPEPDWSSMIEPFQLEGPLIVVGLDTVVTGNIDHFADYCETADKIALPKSPGKPYACNALALVPSGHADIFHRWRGENDMEWLRAQAHAFIDDLWPSHVASYKCDVRPNGLGDARVVYFHGRPKPDDIRTQSWIKDHWR